MKVHELRVVLSIRTGESPLTEREFVWGTPAPPFSVGANGDWPIQAPAVEGIHLFLAFDGYRLHAAAASGAHDVSIDGVPLGSGWTHVAVPSLVAFGAARIAVGCEDAAQVEREPVRPHPIIDLSRPDRQPTQVMDLSRTLRLQTVRLEISEDILTELRAASPLETTPELVTPPTVAVASVPSRDTSSFQPAPVQTLIFARPEHLQPEPAALELGNTLYDGGALRELAAQLAAARDGESQAPCAQSVAAPRGLASNGVMRRPLAAFRQSSWPKQLTIALLPLAVGGVWAMRDSAASASSARPVASVRIPAHPVPPPSSSTAPAASLSPASSTATAATATAAASNESILLEAAARPSDRSERLALIAAFSGNKAEAAALYDRLAATRNSRTFALAARLTREDHVRKP